MRRGDIYLLSIDASEDEENKERVVLVISPESFNNLTHLPIVLPITNKGDFARTAGFAVLIADSNLQTVGVIRCDQPRIVDLEAYAARKLESVPTTIVEEVLAKIAPILE